MCVIIYVPKTENISIEELNNAWDTNPDGAGFSIQKDGKVIYERGFMNKADFINKVTEYIGKYNLMLHFRISTSSAINRVQCHPYDVENITQLAGETKNAVACMNGIVYCDYIKRAGYNDTMSYIADHKNAFKNINQHIIDMIEDVTFSKWFVMLPDKVLMSKGFEEHNGKYYSNTNHFAFTNYRSICCDNYDDWYDDWYENWYEDWYRLDNTDNEFESEFENIPKVKEKIRCFFTNSMVQKLKNHGNGDLWEDILFFIYDFCCSNKHFCKYCDYCFSDLIRKNDIIDKMEDINQCRY